MLNGMKINIAEELRTRILRDLEMGVFSTEWEDGGVGGLEGMKKEGSEATDACLIDERR